MSVLHKNIKNLCVSAYFHVPNKKGGRKKLLMHYIREGGGVDRKNFYVIRGYLKVFMLIDKV